jgi:hypothetical protein
MAEIQRVKITRKDGYRCVPPMSGVPVTFACGDIVDGQVAKWAVMDGAGSPMFPEKPAEKPAAKRLFKARKAAPENKSK